MILLIFGMIKLFWWLFVLAIKIMFFPLYILFLPFKSSKKDSDRVSGAPSIMFLMMMDMLDD